MPSEAMRWKLKAGTLHTLQGAVLGFGLLVLVTLVSLTTRHLSDQPTGPGIAVDPINSDYLVPLVRAGSEGGNAQLYVAETSFWSLLPQAWRSGAVWTLTWREAGATHSHVIPSDAIGLRTQFRLGNRVETIPQLVVHWNQTYAYEFPTTPPTDTLVEEDGTSTPVLLQNAARVTDCVISETSNLLLGRPCSPGDKVVSFKPGQSAQIKLANAWPPTQATLAFWMRPLAYAQSDLVTSGDHIGSNRSIVVTMDVSGRLIVLVSTDGRTTSEVFSNRTVPLAVWSYVVVSLSRDVATLYLDGDQQTSVHIPGPVKATRLPITLGTSESNPQSVNPGYSGELAAVRFGNSTWSSSEVKREFVARLVRDNGPDSNLAGIRLMPSDVALPGVTPYEWWRRHLMGVGAVGAAYLLLLGVMLGWSLVGIKRHLLFPRSKILFGGVVVALVIASTITTNFDLQLFKGLDERYWLDGPIPALTLSGYGPLVDAIFILPALPYILISHFLGVHSEFGLNLALRLPFLVGWVFLLAATSRLVVAVKPAISPASAKLVWLTILLNPTLLLMTLWQPEGLLVGLVVLSLALLLEEQPLLSGVVFGLAFAGKYWPAVVGPILLIVVWRSRGKKAAGVWLASAVGAAAVAFAAYWGPTLAAINSWPRFWGLVLNRLPFFAGSGSASQASIWSLYALPKQLLPGPLAQFFSILERLSIFIIVGVCLLVAVLLIKSAYGQRRAILAAGAVLAAVASLSALTVPQFAIWCLPFVLVSAAMAANSKRYVVLAIAATFVGTLVSVFVEPISLWFLHVSSSEDRWAFHVADWFSRHVTSMVIARTLGFLFAAFLLGSAAFMVREVVRPADAIRAAATAPQGSRVWTVAIALALTTILVVVITGQTLGVILLLAIGMPPVITWTVTGRVPGVQGIAAAMAGLVTYFGAETQSLIK